MSALLRRVCVGLTAAWATAGCSLPQECPGSLNASLGEHVGQKVSLRDVTDFAWQRAHLYRSRASAERIRRKTGVLYRPYADRVPQGRNLLAFQLGPQTYCLASVDSFRYRIDLEGRDWFASAPWFVVREREGWPRLGGKRRKTGSSLACKPPRGDDDPLESPLGDEAVIGKSLFGTRICDDAN